MAPLNAGVTSATLGGSVNLGLGFNCSGFNPVLGLANTLNTAAKNIQGVLVNAASGAIASAPALILQRASPGLYELYQQLLSYANGAVTLATKSCEQMQPESNRATTRPAATLDSPIPAWRKSGKPPPMRLTMHGPCSAT